MTDDDVLWKIGAFIFLLAVWLVVWTFTVYWTVRLVHTAWLAGPM